MSIEASEQVQVDIGDEVASPTTPTETVRAWAVQNGYEVKATGRLPQAVKDAYAEANQG